VSPTTLVCATTADVPAALAAALDGGAPVAPLPEAALERAQVLAMLAPAEPVTEADAAVVVATSGSTGRPKGVVLSRAAIVAAVTATHERLGGPGSWVAALPVHYVAGLMVLARSLVAGTPLAQVGPDLAGLPAAVAAVPRPRYLSVVPTQLARACADPVAAAGLAACDAVLVGGAALGADLHRRAAALGIRAVTTYGMSETCGGCVYDGVPLTGVQVKLDPQGQIGLHATMLFSGYRNRPDLTAAALRSGTLWTGDRGRLINQRLIVDGRADDVVVTGGHNVDLAELERLAAHWSALGGAEIAILGIPDDEWGTRVVAVTEADVEAGGLRDYLKMSVPAYAAPRAVVRVAALPRTAAGKVDRSRLRDDLTSSEAAR
jgi:O-succinylbenzoic acid--CoA ligase